MAQTIGKGTLAVAHQAGLGFALGDMHGHRIAGARGKRKERIAHGVWRVRGDAEPHEGREARLELGEAAPEAGHRIGHPRLVG
jgi:hypothetical protein